MDSLSNILFEIHFPTSRLIKRQLPSFLGTYPVPRALRNCVEAQSDVLVVQPCLGEVRVATKILKMTNCFSYNITLAE